MSSKRRAAGPTKGASDQGQNSTVNPQNSLKPTLKESVRPQNHHSRQRREKVPRQKKSTSRNSQKVLTAESGRSSHQLRSRGNLPDFKFQSPPRITGARRRVDNPRKKELTANDGNHEVEPVQPLNQYNPTVHPSIETEVPADFIQACKRAAISTSALSDATEFGRVAYTNSKDPILDRLQYLQAKRELFRSHGLDTDDMSSERHDDSQLQTPGPSENRTFGNQKVPQKLFAKTHPGAFRELLEDYGIHKDGTTGEESFSELENHIISSCKLCKNHSVSEEDEKNWATDLVRCKDAPEALLQHTILMHILDRFNIDLKIFNYSCDTLWRSKSLPRYDGRPASFILAKPKPDLVVGFQLSAILPDSRDKPDIKTLFSYMCPEDSKNCGSAFPFLIFEAKGSTASVANDQAALQVKNDAAQALYNMFKFVRGSETKKKFLAVIRVFSVSLNPTRIQIRMHWITFKEPKKMSTGETSRSKPWYENKMIIEYPQPGGSYTKTGVLACYHNILEYASDSMMPFLKNLVQKEVEHAEEFGPHESSEERFEKITASKTTTSGSNKRKRSSYQIKLPPVEILPQSNAGAQQIDARAANTSFCSNDSTTRHLTSMNLNSGGV